MKAEEALEQSTDGKAYAHHRGDLLILWKRDDGYYILEFIDFSDSKRRGMYINSDLQFTLERNKRYRAEWYCSEQEARNGRQPEEFFVYTYGLYQSYETGEVYRVKFCNGEVTEIFVLGLDEEKEMVREDDVREFLLHSDAYKELSCWWIRTVNRSEREKSLRAKKAQRVQKYRYVYHNVLDESEHEEFHENIKRTAILIRAHFRRGFYIPLLLETPQKVTVPLQKEEFLKRTENNELVTYLEDVIRGASKP